MPFQEEETFDSESEGEVSTESEFFFVEKENETDFEESDEEETESEEEEEEETDEEEEDFCLDKMSSLKIGSPKCTPSKSTRKSSSSSLKKNKQRIEENGLKAIFPTLMYEWEDKSGLTHLTVDILVPQLDNERVKVKVNDGGLSFTLTFVYPLVFTNSRRLKIASSGTLYSGHAKRIAMNKVVNSLYEEHAKDDELIGTFDVDLPFQVEKNLYTDRHNTSGSEINSYNVTNNQFGTNVVHVEMIAVKKVKRTCVMQTRIMDVALHVDDSSDEDVNEAPQHNRGCRGRVGSDDDRSATRMFD